jgi:hypothetical protein
LRGVASTVGVLGWGGCDAIPGRGSVRGGAWTGSGMDGCRWTGSGMDGCRRTASPVASLGCGDCDARVAAAVRESSVEVCFAFGVWTTSSRSSLPVPLPQYSRPASPKTARAQTKNRGWNLKNRVKPRPGFDDDLDEDLEDCLVALFGRLPPLFGGGAFALEVVPFFPVLGEGDIPVREPTGETASGP